MVQPNRHSGHLSSHGCRCSAAAHIHPSRRHSAAACPCFMHAGAVPLHLPPSSRHSSTASPPSWLTQVHRRPPSLALLLTACAQPALRSFPTSCRSLPKMTQAAPDLVGMSEEVAARPLPIVFLCFWRGVGEALLPASALSPRRHLGDDYATP